MVDNMKVRIDTREQHPLEFVDKDIELVAIDTIPIFDYAIDGDEENFAVERKSLEDFISSFAMKAGLEHELAKIRKAREAGIFPIYYVVEANFRDVERFNYRCFKSGKVTPAYIYKRWRMLESMGVRVVWAEDAVGAAKAITCLFKNRKEELDNMDEELHARYSPSSLKHWAICPLWSRDVELSTSAAEEGTMLHKAMETGDFTDLTQDQLSLVQACQEYVSSLIDPYSEVNKEVRLSVQDLTWGTADVVIRHPQTGNLDLVDYKFGRVAVDDAKDNLQGWAYAIGAIEKWNAPQCTVHFLQPRCDMLTTHTFNKTDIRELTRRIAEIIAKAKDTTSSPVYDAYNCKFCTRRGHCPAIGHTMKAVMCKIKMDDLPELPHPDSIDDPALVSKWAHAAAYLEAFLKKVKQRALDLAKQGVEIPGYTLATKRGKRRISDVLKLWEILENKGISFDKFVQAVDVSLERLDDSIKETLPKGNKVSGLKDIHRDLVDLGIEVPGEEIEYLRKEKE